jgi:hypothetical protein
VKKSPFAIPLLAMVACTLLLTGCGQHSDATIGKVDVEHLMTIWPEGKKQSDDLAAAQSALATSAQYLDPQARQDAQARAALQAAQVQATLAEHIRQASTMVALHDHLKLVVTRDFVGWGGRDITDEVLSELVHSDKPTQPHSATTAPMGAP